jgi:hypothetical protein
VYPCNVANSCASFVGITFYFIVCLFVCLFCLFVCFVAGSVLKAQHRGRSVQSEYVEFVGSSTQMRKEVVLELFNLTLGWGPTSDKFWSGRIHTS